MLTAKDRAERAPMERRKHPRAPYGAWVEDLTLDSNIQFYMARDISIGGLLLLADEPPPLGHKVHLQLVIENESQVVAVEGKVVRHSVTPDGLRAFAVSFINLDEGRKTFLRALLTECAHLHDSGSSSGS